MLRGTSPLARDSLDKQKLTIFADLESGGCFKVPFNAVRKNSFKLTVSKRCPRFLQADQRRGDFQ